LKKERLDVLLVERKIFESRHRARASIMAGEVSVNGVKADKPGICVHKNANIDIKESSNPYVSRGGLKLQKAIESFSINMKDKVTIDIGASTGGFTDCMLQNGAKKVIAIDVGYGQFAWKLRSDERVILMERTNIRNVTKEQLPQKANMTAIDVSFISLKKVIPVAIELTADDAEFILLVKPQFEVGKGKVGKNGVVKDMADHQAVLYDIVHFCRQHFLQIDGIDFSPIKGPKGNIEYLIYASKAKTHTNTTKESVLSDAIQKIVHNAHTNLY